MSLSERLGIAALQRMDPETAHGLATRALALGLAPLPQVPDLSRLHVSLAGMELKNPLGLAAGFDKNAHVAGPLSRAGFGFVELGGVTPRPQPGNPRPRLFRLPMDHAVINRFGLNNEGAEAIAARLKGRPRPVPLGLNLGANKDSPDRAADYAEVLRVCGPHIDYATVNVSSPNTERLRELQGAEALTALLAGVLTVRDALPRRVPVFVKIAPDLTEAEIADIAAVSLSSKIDGIVATNTTIARDGLTGPHARETGGLSGRPLFRRSTQVLARLAKETGGKLPLIGVGGIEDAETAYAKIRAGATALQIYSALVYEGLGLIPRILTGLDALLERDGFATISEATGTAIEDWI